ncbi:MAG: hypothetical protein WAQ28_14590 [Bacteroidia bacterium]
MSLADHHWFELLKKEIADTYGITYPSCQLPVEEWKGQDIVNFQEELIKKVKGRISEKWFYTHIKSRNEKLPRIDMLNMLSQYAGYQDWRDFVNQKQHSTKENEVKAEQNPLKPIGEVKEIKQEKRSFLNKKRAVFVILGSIISIFIAFLLIFKQKSTYSACFSGLNGSNLIENAKIEVRILKEKESPLPVACKGGCFEYKTSDKFIRYSIQSPYYQPDTITRSLTQKSTNEQIVLKTNDYALMIHFFSTSSVNDWITRRKQLDDMIAADAKIYQVYEDGSGMEMYNKEEFVNKLTMPLESLKNIEIMETDYSEGQISVLRFTQKDIKDEK